MELTNEAIEKLEEFLLNVEVGKEIPRTISSGLDIDKFREGLLDGIKGMANEENKDPSYQVGKKVIEFDCQLALPGRQFDSLRYHKGLMDGIHKKNCGRVSADYLNGYNLGLNLQ